MKRNKATSLVLVLTLGAWLSPACGGDSEGDDGKTTVTGGTGGAGGTGGSIIGGTGGTSTTGGAGGSGGAGDGGKCKAADCPGFGNFVQGCCLPTDECGYDGTALGLGCVSQQQIGELLEGGIDVQVPADASDPNCADYTVAGFTLKGCCPSTGFCGVFAPIINTCYDWNSLPPQVPKPDNIVPKPCGSGVGDGGVDAATDVSAEAATDAGAG
jgi:hypothetical protein